MIPSHPFLTSCGQPLIEFDLPPVRFVFEYELIVVLYPFPTVNLEVGFSFTAELKVGQKS
jgi:hypothetical protein